MTTIILLAIAFTSFVSYVAWVWVKFGILPSISDSYYHSHNNFLFWAFLIGLSVPVILVGSSALTFFAGAFLCFTASAPAFKQKMEGIVHVIGATGGIFLGVVATICDMHLWIPAVLMVSFTVLATVFKLKHHTWWIEIVAFVTILASLVANKIFLITNF